MKKAVKIFAVCMLSALLLSFAFPVHGAPKEKELFHFSFDDESNIGLDSAGNGTVSEDSNLEDLITTDGIAGKAASFDGLSTALYINSALDNVKDFTVTYWVNLLQYSEDFIAVMAGDSWSSEHNVLHTNITPEYGIEIGASAVNWDGEREYKDCIELETWYYVAFSVSLTEGKTVLYLNGEPVHELECSGDTGVDFSKFTIGAWRNGEAFCRYLEGDIDELIVYEGALGKDAIKANYDAVKNPVDSKPTPTDEAPTKAPDETEKPTEQTNTATNGAPAQTGTPTPSAPDADSNTSDAQTPTGSIGIIVLIVVAIIACCVGTFFILKKKKK